MENEGQQWEMVFICLGILIFYDYSRLFYLKWKLVFII
jgi:hypothetical protein